MTELDLVWFLALLGTPLLFSIITILSSFNFSNITPYFASLGAAITLGITLGIVVQFKYDTIEQLGVLDDENTRMQTSLFERGKTADLVSDFEVRKSFDWIVKVRWLPKLGINFILGLDGINLSFTVLVALIYFLAILAGWLGLPIKGHHFSLILLSEFGVLGSLLAIDGLIALIFLALTLLTFYFLLQTHAGSNRNGSAYLFGVISSVGLILLASVLTYCYKTDTTKFANQGEIETTRNQLQRSHPEWTDKQISDYLTHHTFNTLVSQRAGIDQLVQSKTGQKKSSSKTHTFAFLALLTSALLLGLASPLTALFFKTYEQAYLPVALIFATAFPLLGMYVLTRFGIQIFPAGLVSSATWLTWTLASTSIVLGILFLCTSSPERFLTLLVIWLQMVCYLGVMASFAGSPDVWKSKTFAAALLWFLAGNLCFTGLLFLWRQIKDQILVDIVDFKIGTLKQAPFLAFSFSVLIFATLGCPGFLNSIGLFLIAGATLKFGFIPALMTGIGFILVTISCYKILNIILGNSYATPSLTDLKMPQIILVFIVITPLLGLGLFPNLMLSWYLPSTSAISEMIQTKLVK